MRVHWTETAEAHLGAIYEYIARDSETYALWVVDWIRRKSKQIREVFSGPFRIIYHVKADQIDVIAVLHEAMNVLREQQDGQN